MSRTVLLTSSALLLILPLFMMMTGALADTNDRFHYCADNEFFPGEWLDGSWWVPHPSTASTAATTGSEHRGGGGGGGNRCVMANATGLEALGVLRGATVLFLGDSILRQMFHAFVHGVLRDMPVLLDPVYGAASYSRLEKPRHDRCTNTGTTDK